VCNTFWGECRILKSCDYVRDHFKKNLGLKIVVYSRVGNMKVQPIELELSDEHMYFDGTLFNDKLGS